MDEQECCMTAGYYSDFPAVLQASPLLQASQAREIQLTRKSAFKNILINGKVKTIAKIVLLVWLIASNF